MTIDLPLSVRRNSRYKGWTWLVVDALGSELARVKTERMATSIMIALSRTDKPPQKMAILEVQVECGDGKMHWLRSKPMPAKEATAEMHEQRALGRQARTVPVPVDAAWKNDGQ